MEFDTTGLDTLITNAEAEAETGVWLSSKDWGGRDFLVRRAGGANQAYNQTLSTLARPHRRQIDRGTADTDVLQEITMTAHLRTVFKDWRGVKDASGAEVPYDEKAGRAFFKAFPELYGELLDLVATHTTFKQAQLEEAQEDLGNS